VTYEGGATVRNVFQMLSIKLRLVEVIVDDDSEWRWIVDVDFCRKQKTRLARIWVIQYIL